MLLAVLVTRDDRLRAPDQLAPDETPHLTVGRLREGGGWVRCEHSRQVVYRLAAAPRVVPGLVTLEWSREVVCEFDVSELVRHLNSFLFEGRRLLGASVRVDWSSHRYELVGGEALDFYRFVQGVFGAIFESVDAGHAFQLWSQGISPAHISFRYVDDESPASSAVPLAPSSASRTSCWAALWAYWRLSSGSSYGVDGRFSLLIDREAFPRLVGSFLEAEQSLAVFDLWYEVVDGHRRCTSWSSRAVRFFVEIDSELPSDRSGILFFVGEDDFVRLLSLGCSCASPSELFRHWHRSVTPRRRWCSSSVACLVDGVPLSRIH